MKKCLKVFAIIAVLSFATACGNKQRVLDCSKSENSTGMKMTQNIKANFKGNNVKTINMKIDVELEKTYLSYVDTIMKSVESNLSQYKDKKGIELKSEKTDSGFVVKFDADLDDMDKEAKEDLDMMDTKQDYSESKKYFEKEGYTCK